MFDTKSQNLALGPPPSSAHDTFTGRSHQPVRRLKASLIA
jgi:hypothetical protein